MHSKRLKVKSRLALNKRMPVQHVMPNRPSGVRKGAQRKTEANITEIVNRKQSAWSFTPLQNYQIRATLAQHPHWGEGI
jgi:hypothetical protein